MVTRRLWIAAPALVLLAAAVATALALAFGGGAAPLVLLDPGPVVRWGLPVVKAIANIAYGGTLGGLLLAMFAFPFGSPLQRRSLDIAAATAGAWTVAAALVGLLSFLDFTGMSLSGEDSVGMAMAQYFGDLPNGQAHLITAIAAAAITAAAYLVRRGWPLAILTLLTVAAVMPLAQQGHAAGTANHGQAVIALFLHAVAAGAWVGGLLVLALLRPQLGKLAAAAVSRYSSIALVASLIVAATGLVSAWLRIGPDGLFTAYTGLVLVKLLLLAVLASFGAGFRRWVIQGIEEERPNANRRFWSLIAVEVTVMGLVSGVATALARTPTPIPELAPANPTPAEVLTGEPLPPPFGIERLLTEWRFDIAWTLLCLFFAIWYLVGVWRMHRRGDRWPVNRTVWWLLGLGLLWWISNGALNVYQATLFSVHMIAHMLLTMMVPMLLVLGAPVTLSMRAIQARSDGSRGPREWILALVQSRWVQFVGHPIVAAVIFAGSLWVFYYTGLFRWAVSDHIGHHWMMVHFLISGYLFAQALVGIDPGAVKTPYPLRLIVLLGTMAFHAFFGLSLMMGSGLLLADWFGAMGWDTGVSALQDQQDGGGIAWGIGELPTVTLAILVAIMWSRDDEREAKRRDRHADRTDDAELAEYNAMLERLAERDRRG